MEPGRTNAFPLELRDSRGAPGTWRELTDQDKTHTLFKFKPITCESLMSHVQAMNASSSSEDIVRAAFVKQHFQAFSVFFCDIINCSLDIGIVPTLHKKAMVTPLLKKKNQSH